MLPEHPQRRAELLVERAGREVMVYSNSPANSPGETGGAIHALNPTAAVIWDLCDGGHSLADIESAVRLAFAVPAQHDLAADVRATIVDFQTKGLLQD